MDVIEVVAEPGQPLTKNRFDVLYTGKGTIRDFRGAVTAIDGVGGYLITCTGQKDGGKIYVWNFVNKEKLVGIAIVQTQIYATSIAVINNFIIIGDYASSTTVYRFIEEKQRGRVCLCESLITRAALLGAASARSPHTH